MIELFSSTAFWPIVNICFRAMLTLVATVGMIRYGDRLSLAERIGIGMVGGSSIMTIPLIWDVYKRGTPFDGWATSILTIGCIVFATGRMYRIHQHEKNNDYARADAATWLRERGKL